MTNAKVLASNASNLIPKGAQLMFVLVEGIVPLTPATASNLDEFIATVPVPFTAVLDSTSAPADKGLEAYFDLPRDQSLVIDLRTMKLLEIVTRSTKQAMADVQTLLGN